MKNYYIYIITNKKEGVLYSGITSDLIKRIYQHKNKVVDGFSKKYNLHKLVYFEVYDDPENAIKREKRLKKYRRSDKIKLIREQNKNWDDLYDVIA